MKSFEEYKLENNFEKKVINVYDKINDISIIYRGCEYDEIDCSLDNMISFCQEMLCTCEKVPNRCDFSILSCEST